MLSYYLNQKAELKRNIDTDDRGQPIYGEPSNVKCRKQSKVQYILTPTGQTIKTQHIYYLTDKVNEGDMLDGKIVLDVQEWIGLNGEIIGYKAVL